MGVKVISMGFQGILMGFKVISMGFQGILMGFKVMSMGFNRIEPSSTGISLGDHGDGRNKVAGRIARKPTNMGIEWNLTTKHRSLYSNCLPFRALGMSLGYGDKPPPQRDPADSYHMNWRFKVVVPLPCPMSRGFPLFVGQQLGLYRKS